MATYQTIPMTCHCDVCGASYTDFDGPDCGCTECPGCGIEFTPNNHTKYDYKDEPLCCQCETILDDADYQQEAAEYNAKNS